MSEDTAASDLGNATDPTEVLDDQSTLIAALNPQQLLDIHDEWTRKIKLSEQYFKKYFELCDQIVKRYRDERDDTLSESFNRFNLFWSNVQTLGPAVYSQSPKPQVSRRYLDQDKTARMSSMMLERAISYEMDACGYHQAMLESRDDYLLAGRGTHWQRYEPVIENGNVSRETAPLDYVHWKDFFHDAAPTWKRVRWVARRILIDEETAKKRFDPIDPNIAKSLKYNHAFSSDDTNSQKRSQDYQPKDLALIWEIWNKTDLNVIWLSPDVLEKPIDMVDDPLKLNGFFPCPMPLYATTTTDKLIPVPDYDQYRDQAVQIDDLTQRIKLLTQSLAVRGGYDKQNPELANLLSERPENYLVPVDNWAAFAEKGGMKGCISFIPLEVVATTLAGLVQQRAQMKQDVYEITGISDIIRGQSMASETATAQRIKGNFATLRLDDRRKAVARFSRDGIRLMAEVISEHFSPETIREISGFDYMQEVVDLKQQGQNPDELFKAALDLLKKDPMRMTRVDVEVDSFVEADRSEDQQQRMQFLQAAGAFLKEALAAGQQVPEIAPLLAQMLLFGVRGFRVGRELEEAFETAITNLQKAASQPKPPNPAVELEHEHTKAQTLAAVGSAAASFAKAGVAIQGADAAMQGVDTGIAGEFQPAPPQSGPMQ